MILNEEVSDQLTSLASLKSHEMEVPALPPGLNFLFSHSDGILVALECPWLFVLLTTVLRILPPIKCHHFSLLACKESFKLPMLGHIGGGQVT